MDYWLARQGPELEVVDVWVCSNRSVEKPRSLPMLSAAVTLFVNSYDKGRTWGRLSWDQAPHVQRPAEHRWYSCRCTTNIEEFFGHALRIGRTQTFSQGFLHGNVRSLALRERSTNCFTASMFRMWLAEIVQRSMLKYVGVSALQQ